MNWSARARMDDQWVWVGTVDLDRYPLVGQVVEVDGKRYEVKEVAGWAEPRALKCAVSQ